MLPILLDVATLAFSAFSPSKTCKVRVSSTRYRHDPYRARVFAPVVVSPVRRIVDPITAPRPVSIAPMPSIAPIAHPAWITLMASAPTAAPSPVKVPVVAPALKPVVATAASKKPHFALVGFKHETAMYQAPFRVSVGDIVIVEADRGEHIGVVQSITTDVPKYNVPSRVLRHASSSERDAIDTLTVREKATTQSIQRLAESLGLGIRVIDTEFQMDDNKLTVFFASKVFVDFRKLQRGLFREFRCRIWLVNWAEVRSYTPVPVNFAPAL